MRLVQPRTRAKITIRVTTIALVATLLSGIVGSATLASATPVAKPPTYHLKKAGFGIAPGSGFFLDSAHLTSGLNSFKTLGAHWIRSTIPWLNFQPDDPQHLAKGEAEYNWKGVDALAATLRKPAYKGRFSLIVTIEAPPTWATASKRITHVDCSDQAPFDLPSYARAAAALAAHLAGTAHVFEVENSPNIARRSAAHSDPYAVWPVPNPCAYADLMRLTTAAVHKAQKGSTVLVGGIGGTKDVPRQRMAADEFLYGLYVNHAAFDGVAFHAYSTPNLPCAPTDKICTFDPNPKHKDPYGMTNGWDRMLNARRVMVAFGDSAKKIWITEFGGPTAGPRGAAKVLTDSQQAALLTAGFQRASQYSWVAEMSWFTYDDKGGDPESDPGGGWMGLIRKNGTHKPSFGAYVQLSTKAT